MVFSDTTNKNGIIQEIEFYTNLGDGAVSGDTTMLKQFTSRVNEAFNRLAPLLVSFGTSLRWDDSNNTDQPAGTFNIVSGQSDYKIVQDANSADILSIARLMILPNATATQYIELEEVTNDDWYATNFMSPNSVEVGVPRWWMKRGSTVYLFPQPNYAATNGCKIFFERQPSYFASTDTTKQPGFPKPFHGLLALYAAFDWLVVNKPDNTALIATVQGQIKQRESDLRTAIKARFPIRPIATTRPIRHR